MVNPVTYLFPWPPSINSLYYQGQTHGQKFLSKVGKAYKQKLIHLHANDDMDPVTEKCSVTIFLIPPTKMPRDTDNYIKPLLDGLKFIEKIEDDKLIGQVMCSKLEPMAGLNKGLAVVTIGPTMEVDITEEIWKSLKESGFDDEDMLLFHVPTKKELKAKEKVK